MADSHAAGVPSETQSPGASAVMPRPDASRSDVPLAKPTSAGRCRLDALQACRDRVLSDDIFKSGPSVELEEVCRLVYRSYVPFLQQWRTERMALVQNFLVLLASHRDEVEFCICLASITAVTPFAEADISRGANPRPASSSSSPAASPPVSTGYGDTPSPGVRCPVETPPQKGNRSWPSSSPSGACPTSTPCPSGATGPPALGQGSSSASSRVASMPIRISFTAGGKQRQMALWTAGSQNWIQVINNLRNCASSLFPICQSALPELCAASSEWQHVAVEDLRASIDRAFDQASLPSPERGERDLKSKDIRAGLQVLASCANKTRRERLRFAVSALRRVNAQAFVRSAAAISLVQNCQRPVLSGALRHWHVQAQNVLAGTSKVDCKDDQLFFNRGCAAAHSRVAEAVAEELPGIWEPLRLSRAALMRRSLKPVAENVQAAAWSDLRANVAHERMGSSAQAAESTERSDRRFAADACAWCLALVARRCRRRHVGIAWRALTSTFMQETYESRLTGLEQRLQEEEETTLVHWESVSRRNSVWRLSGSMLRVLRFQLGDALVRLKCVAFFRARAPDNPSDRACGTPVAESTDTLATPRNEGPALKNVQCWTPSWGTPAQSQGTTPRESLVASGSTPAETPGVTPRESPILGCDTEESQVTMSDMKFDHLHAHDGAVAGDVSKFQWSVPLPPGADYDSARPAPCEEDTASVRREQADCVAQQRRTGYYEEVAPFPDLTRLEGGVADVAATKNEAQCIEDFAPRSVRFADELRSTHQDTYAWAEPTATDIPNGHGGIVRMLELSCPTVIDNVETAAYSNNTRTRDPQPPRAAGTQSLVSQDDDVPTTVLASETPMTLEEIRRLPQLGCPATVVGAEAIAQNNDIGDTECTMAPSVPPVDELSLTCKDARPWAKPEAADIQIGIGEFVQVLGFSCSEEPSGGNGSAHSNNASPIEDVAPLAEQLSSASQDICARSGPRAMDIPMERVDTAQLFAWNCPEATTGVDAAAQDNGVHCVEEIVPPSAKDAAELSQDEHVKAEPETAGFPDEAGVEVVALSTDAQRIESIAAPSTRLAEELSSAAQDAHARIDPVAADNLERRGESARLPDLSCPEALATIEVAAQVNDLHHIEDDLREGSSSTCRDAAGISMGRGDIGRLLTSSSLETTDAGARRVCINDVYHNVVASLQSAQLGEKLTSNAQDKSSWPDPVVADFSARDEETSQGHDSGSFKPAFGIEASAHGNDTYHVDRSMPLAEERSSSSLDVYARPELVEADIPKGYGKSGQPLDTGSFESAVSPEEATRSNDLHHIENNTTPPEELAIEAIASCNHVDRIEDIALPAWESSSFLNNATDFVASEIPGGLGEAKPMPDSICPRAVVGVEETAHCNDAHHIENFIISTPVRRQDEVSSDAGDFMLRASDGMQHFTSTTALVASSEPQSHDDIEARPQLEESMLDISITSQGLAFACKETPLPFESALETAKMGTHDSHYPLIHENPCRTVAHNYIHQLLEAADDGIQAHNHSTSNIARVDRMSDIFKEIDTDKNGVITADEFQAAVQKSLLVPGAALRVAAAQDNANDGVPPTHSLLAMLGSSKAAACTSREVQERDIGAGWV